MSAENEAILAVAWRWHADRLEQNLNSALRALEAAPVDRAMLTEALQSAQLGVVWRPDRAIAAQPGATYQGEGGWSMTSAQVGHALWLCGYHPGDDPVEVFKRAGKRSIEWMEIEALLGKDLAKAREEDPACTVESLVESLRDDAHAFADKIAAQETIILRLEAKAASRQDLRVYEMEECGVPRLAEQAMALFESLPESLEARSYDVARAARIAVRIVCDPSKPRVQTNTVSMDLRNEDPAKLAAALSTPIEPRIANKPAEKRERNIIDEVHGPGFADEYLGETARRYMPTFHLQGGLRRATVHAIDRHTGDIFALEAEGKTDTPNLVQQGIAWRRPGHDVDSFFAALVRVAADEAGNRVVEVHGQLPDDLQSEIQQVMCNRPTITVSTAHGTKFTGPVTAWRRHRALDPDRVTWTLTMPPPNPAPRT